MTTDPSSNPSSAAREAQRVLGQQLRALRKDAGLTARSLAAATGQHFTRVSKIENGVQSPTVRDVRAWCQACRAKDKIPDLLATVRAVESAYLEYRQQARAGMKRVLGAHTLRRYRQTRLFRIYEHNVIPGLFQTRDYAAAMLRFWIDFLGTANDLDDAVDVRMQRQEVVTHGGKHFALVLEEQALRTWFGTARIQAEQLTHLLGAMSQPNVSLGIIPLMAERQAVGSTGFWIFDDTLAALETPTASIEVNRPDELSLYTRMFEVLRTSAVYGQTARALIESAINDLP